MPYLWRVVAFESEVLGQRRAVPHVRSEAAQALRTMQDQFAMSRKPTALVACEFSGVVTQALAAVGFDATSCDLLPAEHDLPHVQGDVRPLLQQPWDIVIAHPPCTRLCNSGVRWLAERDLWADMRAGAEFFKLCLEANAPRVAVENPVMHKHAREIVGRGPDCSVQPWMFGDPHRKRTCFWTKGLPPLVPDYECPPAKTSATVHNESPGPDRWKRRSVTYPGIARAIAEQWALPAGTFTKRGALHPPYCACDHCEAERAAWYNQTGLLEDA